MKVNNKNIILVIYNKKMSEADNFYNHLTSLCEDRDRRIKELSDMKIGNENIPKEDIELFKSEYDENIRAYKKSIKKYEKAVKHEQEVKERYETVIKKINMIGYVFLIFLSLILLAINMI